MFPIHPVALAAACCLAVGAAHAQTSAPATAPSASPTSPSTPASAAVQRVEVTGAAPVGLNTTATAGSRLGLTLRETPATVVVVDRSQIDALGALDTQDILRAVPGVSFSAQPGSPGSVFYRGFGAASLAQLYNGISVQYDAIAARPVDAWLVERVEAVGGPSSFLNGSGAVGGSINVITKVADTQGDLHHARVAVGDQRQAAASLQRGLGAHVLRADVNATRGTQPAMGRDRDSWQAALSWRVAPARGLSHTLAVEQQHERVDQPYWGTPLLRDASNAVVGEVRIDPRTRDVNYNAVDGVYVQDVLWARSVLQWQLAPATAFTHTAYHYEALRDYENIETYNWANNNTQVERSAALLQRHNQDVSGSRGELTHRTQVAGLKSDFVLGWDASDNRQTRYPLSVAGPFGRVDPYAPAAASFYATPGITPGYTPGATNRLRSVALFAENRTVLAPRWALTTALRVDHIDLKVTNHRAVTATNPALFSTTFRPATGRVGVVHDLSPTWQVYAQYSTAADPPAGLLATAGFAALRDFDLTRGRQFELGSKASFDGDRGEVSVAAYGIQRKNLAITDPNDRTKVLPVGQQSSRGVEVHTRWKPAAAWQLSAQLAYTQARFDDFFEAVGTTVVSRAGNRPANTPDWVTGVALSWQPVQGVTVTADWRHVGQRFANTANSAWASAYDLLGVSASWQPWPGMTLRGRVNNLTDKTYAATVGTGQVVLGAGRTASLSADWRF